MNQITKLDEFERKREIVNNAVRICVTCGNIGVKIDNFGIFCKECGSKFQREEACACQAYDENMSTNLCSSICRYYQANASYRKSSTSIYKKWCSVCDEFLISKYHRCPCCHGSLTRGKL